MLRKIWIGINIFILSVHIDNQISRFFEKIEGAVSPTDYILKERQRKKSNTIKKSKKKSKNKPDCRSIDNVLEGHDSDIIYT